MGRDTTSETFLIIPESLLPAREFTPESLPSPREFTPESLPAPREFTRRVPTLRWSSTMIRSINWDVERPRRIHIFLGTPREFMFPPRTTLCQNSREASVTPSMGPQRVEATFCTPSHVSRPRQILSDPPGRHRRSGSLSLSSPLGR